VAIKIRPYNFGSKGARLLRDCLSELVGRKVWMSDDNNFLRRHTVINWGDGADVRGLRIINNAAAVSRAVNKLLCFRALPPNMIPEWTDVRHIAEQWTRNGDKVYCRTRVASQEGIGIVIANTPQEVVNAPLYTKRFKHTREYRVHIAFGNVIQVVQKRKRNGATNANPLIRANDDWVFARHLTGPQVEIDRVKAVALQAVTTLGLDFGACDVLYSNRQQRAVVLECNTAPGLDRTSASLYAQAIYNELHPRRG